MTRMHIHEWPREERPREKLLARGPAALSDAELLALFLGSGIAGMDAVATARQLLVQAGGLRALMERDAQGLRKLKGLGPARSSLLAAALELGNRHLAARLERGDLMANPEHAARYFAQRLRGHDREVFAAMFLDVHRRTLAFEELFRGGLAGIEIHPREVVRRALTHNAAAVIVGHNHPSGNPEPSNADRTVTLQIKQSLELVDVHLIDHFVIGDGPPVSMAARGWV